MFFAFTVTPAVYFWEAYFEALDLVLDDESKRHVPWKLKQIVKYLSKWPYVKMYSFLVRPVEKEKE